jgi:hypothetical protein
VWTLHATKRNTRASLSPGPEEDRRGDRHLSGSRQRLCVDIYHVIFFFRFPTTATVPSATHPFSSRKDAATSLEFHHCSTCTVIFFPHSLPFTRWRCDSVVLLHKSFHTCFLGLLPVPIFNTWCTPTLLCSNTSEVGEILICNARDPFLGHFL